MDNRLWKKIYKYSIQRILEKFYKKSPQTILHWPNWCFDLPKISFLWQREMTWRTYRPSSRRCRIRRRPRPFRRRLVGKWRKCRYSGKERLTLLTKTNTFCTLCLIDPACTDRGCLAEFFRGRLYHKHLVNRNNLLWMEMQKNSTRIFLKSFCLPIATGGREVNSKLYNIRYIWSIMTVPEKPQYSWYQKHRKTNAYK